MPFALYMLTIQHGELFLCRGNFALRVTSKEQVEDYLSQYTKDSGLPTKVTLSSSIDFPEEFTRDPKVIELAKSFWR